MKTRIKILFIIVTLAVTMSLMSNTYSRYVAESTSNVQVSFAKWQILLNETDITNGTTSNIELTPIIEPATNIKANTIAPSSKGYFDILINPSNVEVSFDYKLTLKLLNVLSNIRCVSFHFKRVERIKLEFTQNIWATQ